MKIGIYTNIHKDTDLSVTKKIIYLIGQNNIDYYLYDVTAKLLNINKSFNEKSDIKFDIMLTIGGDGTILRIVDYCSTYKIPILGINLGMLGFLTEVELDSVDNIFRNINKNNYTIEKRAMLEFTHQNKTYKALNEVVISRENDSRMLSVDVSISGQFFDNFYCDGFIVCTPTGSTAYSLSAGGPIISPNTEVFALTSINSHSLHSRPLVISNKEKVILSIKKTNNQRAKIIVDGNSVGVLDCSQEIEIKKSDYEALFLRLSDTVFYSKLLSKLNSWSVTN